MVLTRSRFHLPRFRLPLQPIRYTSMSIAIAVNIAVALLLSLPREHEFDPLIVDRPPQTDVVFIPPPQVVPIKPVPPLPEPPPNVPRRQEVVQVELTQPAPTELIVDTPTPMSTHVEAVPQPSETTAVAPVAALSQGASVAYETAPPPRYPRDLQRAGITGKVLLRILVSPTGHPEQVEVESSSGRAAFDRAAREQVLRRWKFHPALRNGEPVRAWVRVPIEFSIH